jgi:hypothetical protein
MIKFKNYTEGKRRSTVAGEISAKSGRIGGDKSDAQIKRGGVERYDKYDKGNAKKKKEILQNELEYYMTERHPGEKWSKLSKKQKFEISDDIDDKFAHQSDTYKLGSIKISSSGKII